MLGYDETRVMFAIAVVLQVRKRLEDDAPRVAMILRVRKLNVTTYIPG